MKNCGAPGHQVLWRNFPDHAFIAGPARCSYAVEESDLPEWLASIATTGKVMQ
jgi:hypothetical protein